MKEKFKQYLIEKGYKEFTKSRHPSTVYDYLCRINKISKHYHKDIYSIKDMKELKRIRDELNKDGKNEKLGNQSHRAVYNAMKRYCEFFQTRETIRPEHGQYVRGCSYIFANADENIF